MLFCERTTFSLQPQLRNDLLVILWCVCVEESSLFWESPNAAEEYTDRRSKQGTKNLPLIHEQILII